MLIQGQVGPVATNTSLSPGQQTNARFGNMGDLIMSELHGRFYEATYRGTMFSTGSSLTALSANTITLVAATTPIVGVWNPQTSTANLVIAQSSLQAYINTLTTPVGAGAFVWAVSTGNAAITTGAAPWNRKTMTQTGSQAKAFNGGVPLTGLTNNLVIVEGSDFTSPTGQTYGTITAPTTGTSLGSFGGVQNFDGSWIVPPGGVLALLNTTSTTTMSAISRLLWEEVPL
jgi:hypothetical protein